MTNHHFEGQPLGKIAVLLSVCGADQFVQVFPPAALFFLGLDSCLLFLYPLFSGRIFTQLVLETGNDVP